MNEHNPIAHAISLLQNKWNQTTHQGGYQLVRWVARREDTELIRAMLKLESTPHGSLEETFFVFLTGFEGAEVYAHDFATDWLNLYEKEARQHAYLSWNDFEYYKNSFSKNGREDETANTALLVDMLSSFKKFEDRRSAMVIGIIPNAVIDAEEFADWILKMVALLPPGIAITIIDNASDARLDSQTQQHPDIYRTIYTEGIIDAKSIYKKLATQGNPNDPQIMYRKCLFEMGEAARNGNKNEVCKWGDEALNITQKTGDKLFWAAAHITYAGFLFGFKDEEKINTLLDKGIVIVKPLLKIEQQKTNAAGMLGQFYAYKGAFAGICKKNRESIGWFEKQGDLMVAYDQATMAVGAYQNALLLALRHKYGDLVNTIVHKAFPIGYTLEDDWLRSTGFPVIAYHYMDTIDDSEEKEKINRRLTYLYGDDWQRSARKSLAVAPEEYVR